MTLYKRIIILTMAVMLLQTLAVTAQDKIVDPDVSYIGNRER